LNSSTIVKRESSDTLQVRTFSFISLRRCRATQGEAAGLADVLLGDKPFVGTTPYTWPKTAGEAPRVGKSACDGAVYLFGYGMDATGRLLGPAAC
jgi:hypothetical protein